MAVELFTIYTPLAFGVTVIVAAACVLLEQIRVSCVNERPPEDRRRSPDCTHCDGKLQLPLDRLERGSLGRGSRKTLVLTYSKYGPCSRIESYPELLLGREDARSRRLSGVDFTQTKKKGVTE